MTEKESAFVMLKKANNSGEIFVRRNTLTPDHVKLAMRDMDVQDSELRYMMGVLLERCPQDVLVALERLNKFRS